MAIIQKDEFDEADAEPAERPPEADPLDEGTIAALTDLLAFLEHESVDVREGAAKAASGLSGTEEGREVLMRSKLDPISKLVPMMHDSSPLCAKLALAALVNLCEYEDYARGVVVKAGAMPQTMLSVCEGFDSKSNLEQLANGAKLLANLTRHHHGRQAVVGFHSDGSQAANAPLLRRLCDAFGLAGSSVATALTPLAMFFENVAAAPGGATLLCSEEHGFMLLTVARQIASGDEGRRMGAAGAVKNCCFDRTVHDRIAEHTEVAALVCLPLVGERDGYDEEDVREMPAGLQTKCRLGGRVAESEELRTVLYETLMLLTRSREGREYLRDAKIYPIIREVHKFEESFQKPNEQLVELLENVVDQVMLLDEPAAQVD